jgi:hypothetical protein
MKTLFKLVLVLAVANLLAVAGFVGWLFASGRVDGERLGRVRELFAQTIRDEKAKSEELATAEAEAVRLAGDERRLRELPIARADQIVQSERFEQRATLAMRSLEEGQRRMQADLAGREQSVTDRETSLATRQKEWEASIAAEKERETDEQFRKVVRLLESVPPKQARDWISELVRTGRIDQAVAYLDAMNRAKSSALLKAFKGETDTKVATDLLERLRVLGLESEVGLERPNAADSAEPSAEPARRTPGTAAAPGSGPTANGPVALPGNAPAGAPGGR